MTQAFSVTIQSRSVSVDSEGIQNFTYSTLKTIMADVQPASLSTSELQIYGVNDLTANARRMYYNPDSSIDILTRLVIDSHTYEVRGVNFWPRHSEALLFPLQGVGA
jgi:hypothetical protein